MVNRRAPGHEKTCKCERCKTLTRDYSTSRRARLYAERITGTNGRPYHPRAAHGTSNGYTSYGCRCDKCRQAMTDTRTTRVTNRFSQRIEVNGRLVHPQADHGTVYGYIDYGCRCDHCTTAQSAHRKRFRRK